MTELEHDAKRAKTEPQLVQISASKEVVEKRIAALIERKQAERNESNFEEFVDRRKRAHAPGGSAAAAEVGSARTDAAQLQRASQIRVIDANNVEGPLDTSNRLPTGVDCRLSQLENYLDVKTYRYVALNAPKDVYERLQRIEDRVLELEKIASVVDLLRIHKGKCIDTLIAELNGCAPAPPTIAAASSAYAASLPAAAKPIAPLSPALVDSPVMDELPAAPRRQPAAALPVHTTPPAAAAAMSSSATEDARQLEERIAQLKASLRRKQEEKNRRERAAGT